MAECGQLSPITKFGGSTVHVRTFNPIALEESEPTRGGFFSVERNVYMYEYKDKHAVLHQNGMFI